MNTPQNHKSANNEKELAARNKQPPISDKFEAQEHAEKEGKTKHEGKDPAPPPMFAAGITNMRTNSYSCTGSQQTKLHFKSNRQRHNKNNNKQTGISQNNNRHTKREKN
jgi:hypothetical protein